MPRIEFKSENKTQSGEIFPKLKLKNGERKRILCIEDPVVNYVHTIRAPKIVNGKGIEEQKQRKDGSYYTTFQQEFISNPICKGDMATLEERGVDPKNCPACAASIDVNGLDRPKRRFAMHVVVYKTKPDGTTISSPFSCDVVVWGFTDQVFNQLVDFRDIQGDLKDHDIFLGPCEDETYQKYKIMAGPDAAYKGDAARKSLVLETFNENQAEDLDPFCGRKVSLEYIKADVDRAVKQWAIANGEAVPSRVDAAANSAQLSSGLDSLLADVPTPSSKSSGDAIDFEDVVNGLLG